LYTCTVHLGTSCTPSISESLLFLVTYGLIGGRLQK
jgi:hypothetical protein